MRARVCAGHLHILDAAGLSLTQRAEQLQDELLNVLQRLLLGLQVRMHLVQDLEAHKSSHYTQ